MTLKEKTYNISGEHIDWKHVEAAIKELKKRLNCDNPKEDDVQGNITSNIIDEVFG